MCQQPLWSLHGRKEENSTKRLQWKSKTSRRGLLCIYDLKEITLCRINQSNTGIYFREHKDQCFSKSSAKRRTIRHPSPRMCFAVQFSIFCLQCAPAHPEYAATSAFDTGMGLPKVFTAPHTPSHPHL